MQNATGFTIRPAASSDVADMARLMVLSYRFGFSEILSQEVLETRNELFFTKRFEQQWQSMHLAETANRHCIGLFQVTGHHLDLFFIDPAYSGSALSKTLLRQAEMCGAETLECFRDNTRARRFYEREGWAYTTSYERDFEGTLHAFVSYTRRRRNQI